MQNQSESSKKDKAGTKMSVKSCLNCKDRVLGCHSHCASYAEQTRQHAARRAKQRKDSLYAGYFVEQAERFKRR